MVLNIDRFDAKGYLIRSDGIHNNVNKYERAGVGREEGGMYKIDLSLLARGLVAKQLAEGSWNR
jgi:hypothetical protein